jgi:hypothetical protein
VAQIKRSNREIEKLHDEEHNENGKDMILGHNSRHERNLKWIAHFVRKI